MASSAGVSKYELFTITKNGKTIPLQSKVTSFDYYESLLSPNITATMTYVDTGLVELGERPITYDKQYDPQETVGTIYNALPITGNGNEEVRFKITSGLGSLDFSKTPLYVNGSINPDQESRREAVILSLVSKSAITNQQTHVKKNYSKSTNNGQSAQLIAREILKLPNNKLQIEETKNKYPFIGNNKSPFDTLIMLAAKSEPKEGNPGFFFYETHESHNFRSIDSLISQKPVAEYYKSDVSFSSINANNDFKISSFSINKNQNLINALKSGVYSNRRITFNPNTFSLKEKNTPMGDLQKALGQKEVSKPRNEKYTRVLYSIEDAGALSSLPEEGNSSGDPLSWQGKTQMRYNLLFTQVAKIQVPCNPSLKAGDVIRCLIDTISNNQKVQAIYDPVESGKYLILDLCHHYDTERSFTSLTLVRDTYGLYTNKN